MSLEQGLHPSCIGDIEKLRSLLQSENDAAPVVKLMFRDTLLWDIGEGGQHSQWEESMTAVLAAHFCLCTC